MSSAPERYYRPAGTVPFLGTLLMLVLGGMAALLFSFLYALILMYVPYDKIMFLGTVALGVGVGGMVRGGALAGGVTSRIYVVMVALLCGGIATYFTWAWFILLWQGVFVIDPMEMVLGLIDISRVGIRENTATGIALQLLWLGEALLIVGCALGIAVMEYRPYCHDCRRWTQELPAKCALPRTEVSGLQADLEEEQYETIDQLATQEIDPSSHCALSLMKCPECSDAIYLTVDNVDVTVNKKGEASVQTRHAIRHLHVPESVVDQVMSVSSRQQGPALQDLDFGAASGSGDEVTKAQDES